jgi:transposase-like protein
MNTKRQYSEYRVNEIRGNSANNHSSDEKIRFIKDVISQEITVNKLYNRESIDTNLFNKCTRDFIEIEKGRFVHNVRSEVTSFEINHLKNQNILLKQLIAELSHENHVLKDRLFSMDNMKIANE